MEIILSELASENKAHPEIVLCVKNDNTRAINFSKIYSKYFYLVFLCDGDFDELLEYVRSSGAGKISVFRRIIDNMLPEDYFINYLKRYSPSGVGIFLCTDEVINWRELHEIFDAEEGYVISTTRKDFINGFYFKNFKGIIRGGSSDKLLSSRSALHKNIAYVNGSKTFNITVEHYSTADLKKEFSKILNYVEMELRDNIDSLRRFIFRRYLSNLVRDALNLKILSRAGLRIYTWNVLMNLLVLIISLILIIEKKLRVQKLYE